MRLGLGVWFGIFVVLVGTSMILDSVFHIRLPVVRVSVGLMFIYLGLRVVTGAWGMRLLEPQGALVMSKRLFRPKLGPEGRLKYDIVFGSGVVDLTQLTGDGEAHVEVNAVFGKALVLVDPEAIIEVEATSAFGEARLPDNNSVAFGELSYRSAGQVGTAPRIHLKVNSVFGAVEVQESHAPSHAGPASTPGLPQPAA